MTTTHTAGITTDRSGRFTINKQYRGELPGNERCAADLSDVRVHDLRHTFATRLRAAGVAEEDRAALLGHALRSMTEHYASGDIGRLVGLANRVLERVGTTPILRVANG